MQDDKPDISVIVPVYKGVRFLREALESVRAQTFRNWECVCVDDGSRDGSGALADEVAASDSRFRVVRQQNGGTSVARNTALTVARGRYIAFLDEDDAYEPRMLETLYTAAEKTHADVVGCELRRMKEQDSLSFDGGPVPREEEWRIADRRTLGDWMAEMYPGVPYEIWRNLYRREVIDEHWFVPNMRVEQDLMWHYTLLPRLSRYVRIDWPGYAWRATANGGYLHPDAASLISLTKTYRHLIERTATEMGLSQVQRERLAFRMSEELEFNIWKPIRKGVRLDSEAFVRLRDGLKALYGSGVDIRRCLSLGKRVKWDIFLRTGQSWWVRA